jgi:hypothetical protein
MKRSRTLWRKAKVPNLLMGTVTFLFTDVEGSTKPWENKAPDMSEALARHDRILREDQRARRLWSVAQAWRETTGTPVGDAERAEQPVRGRRAFAAERCSLGGALAKGRAMTLERTIAYALEEDAEGRT